MSDPKLEYLMTYHADLKEPAPVGKGSFGTRAIYDITGGHFEGPRMKGKILPSGADWILIGDDGFGRLDVRATFETDDGALIYMQYLGILDLQAAAGGSDELIESQFGDFFFMTQPRLETGDERYQWVNQLVVIGQGRTLKNAVEYRLYSVEN